MRNGVPLTDSSSDATPYRFGGQYGYYSDDEERVYVRARHYSTAEGRWVSRDPSGLQTLTWEQEVGPSAAAICLATPGCQEILVAALAAGLTVAALIALINAIQQACAGLTSQQCICKCLAMFQHTQRKMP